MANYPGVVVLNYERSAGLAVMVGAEDMMTKQFLSGVSVDFLKSVNHDFSKGPLRLITMSNEDTDIKTFENLLRQMGENPDDFWKAIAEWGATQEAVQVAAGEEVRGSIRKDEKGEGG
jgi:hypothetical protein